MIYIYVINSCLLSHLAYFKNLLCAWAPSLVIVYHIMGTKKSPDPMSFPLNGVLMTRTSFPREDS